MTHLFSTCRDSDHKPSPSACRLATLELLERTRLRMVADFAEDIGVIDRRDLRAIDGGKS